MDGRASTRNVLALIAADAVGAAWEKAGEMPPEVVAGMDLLRAGDDRRAHVALVRHDCKPWFNPSTHSTVPIPTAGELLERWEVLGGEDLTTLAKYYQLMAGRHRRVYVPEAPMEASWALSRYPHMVKVDGVTLSAEVETELDRHEVDSLDVRREQAEYFEAIDEASALYRNSVEGDAVDERIEASRKAK